VEWLKVKVVNSSSSTAKKKSITRSITKPDFRLYYRAIVTKIDIDSWNRIEAE
jgi:hypothetical protein